ncbi:hypothetical protein BCR43DRAFT_463752 [Syncephalastrum racemosum]|uniref:3-dehydroquinate synthase n=1 Tax=Syncephalastrum racemosum TaxID=13706 RepID=A0A1X2H120_SYNRA|nr:hypothetical protein BCR43DRAFT_463752 [Syncephalastrum racemosum]
MPPLVTLPVLNRPNVIHFGYQMADHIVQDITNNIQVSTYVLITDTHLHTHAAPLLAGLQAKQKRTLVRVLSPGEASKSRHVKAQLEDYLLESQCTRDTCLLALGGGVVGDLVGFVASTFMRGVPFVQIPTTLLAMVDSSIGGKTAIDTQHGKNLIGVFWQPMRIYMDIHTLSTLPPREFANGMAEVIKTAAIWSLADFERLEQQGKGALQDPQARGLLEEAILAAVKVKAEVVNADEREGGLRGLLNFGHSVGHALEALVGPAHGWLHGECVSLGMLLETEIACAMGHARKDAVDRLRRCLALYNLPTDPRLLADWVTVADIMRVMRVDKKNQGNQKKIVILAKIGETLERSATPVDDDVIRSVLEAYYRDSVLTKDSDRVQLQQPREAEQESCKIIVCAAPSVKEWVLKSLVPASTMTLIIALQQEEAEKMILQDDGRQCGNWCIVNFTDQPGSTSLDARARWYECVVKLDEPNAIQAGLAFLAMVARPAHLASQNPSFFVTPTVEDYKEQPPYLVSQWMEGADAVEFRVDLLGIPEGKSWIETAGDQLAILRHRLPSLDMPIIFTTRTIPQAGRFPAESADAYRALLAWGHRWHCAYVDIEFTALTDPILDEIMSVNRACFPDVKTIGSFHDLKGWSSTTMMAARRRASTFNLDVLKLVGTAHSMADNRALENFRAQVDASGSEPVILINMGELGALTRVANRFLTPATHPTLPTVAAPGQLSIHDLKRLRSELKLK